MSSTTVESMNLLAQKNTERINAVCSKDLKKKLDKACKALKCSESFFIKIALIEKLDRMQEK